MTRARSRADAYTTLLGGSEDQTFQASSSTSTIGDYSAIVWTDNGFPTVSSVSPSSVDNNSNAITVTGTNFIAGLLVQAQNADGDIVLHSNNSIILSAEKNISLHANGNIEVGTSASETGQVILQANQVNVQSGGGNLGKHLKQGPLSHVVDSVDSLVGGMVDGIRDMYGVG